VVSIPDSGECFDLDRPGAVAAWNRALNRRYGMENLRRHPSLVVRRIEARRRARIAACVPPFDRALDLGAEDGSLTAAWERKGRFTLRLDIDPAMLRDAAGPAVTADAGALPVAPGSFDVVVLSAILEHVVDPAQTVRESARALRPGGRLVAYVPWDRAVVRVKRWVRRAGLGLGRLHDDIAPGHLRVFDRARLRRLFAPVARDVRIRLDPLSFGYYVEASV
jgi:SAM-dependent methyltransferase